MLAIVCLLCTGGTTSQADGHIIFTFPLPLWENLQSEVIRKHTPFHLDFSIFDDFSYLLRNIQHFSSYYIIRYDDEYNRTNLFYLSRISPFICWQWVRGKSKWVTLFSGYA